MTDSIIKSILLVEDETLLAITEKIQLERYGYTVKTVTTGEKAVEAVKTASDIDLILMDINLGDGIDGTEAAEIILKDHDIPIVFLSSHTDPEVVEKTEKITSYGYVVKNSSITVLDASIKMAFKLSDASRRLTHELTERNKVEEKYHTLFDQSMEGIYLHDLDGHILDVNTMACAQSGYSREELLDLTVFDIHPSEDKTNLPKAEILQAWRQWKTGQRQLVEAEHQRKDGTVYPIEISAGVVRYGNVKRIMAIVKDVTDHRETTNLIKEYSNRLELGMKAANMAWWEMDVETGHVNFSSKKTEMLGYRSDQFHHYEDFTKLVHPDDYEPMMTSMRALLNGAKDKYDVEYRIKAQSGEYRWFRDIGTVTQRIGEGKPLKVSGIVINITERKQAETVLAESVQLLSRAQKIAHIGNWHLDLTTNRLSWSDEIYRTFGCEPQEFAATYEAFLDFVHPEDRVAVDSAYTRSVRDGNNRYEIEHRIVRRDSGDVRYVHERCDHERDEAGTIIRSIGMVQDITERKQAEEEIHKAKNNYHAITNLTGDIIVQVDAEGHWVFLNDIARSFWGSGQEELLRQSFSDFLHPDDREKTTSTIMKMVETGEAQRNLINRQMTPNGWRVVQWNGLPMYDNGEYVGFQATGRDITEQKFWKEILENERRRLAAIIEGTNVGTWEWNVQTGETIFNERWASIIGYTLEEISPVSIETWQRFTNAEDLERSERLLRAHFTGNTEMYENEVQMHHKDGHWVWVLDRGKVATWTEDGKPEWVFGTHQEITERKQADRVIQKQLTEKEVLLREVHHRVKNNIATIESLLSLQAGSTAHAVVKAALQDTISRVQSMRVLYDRLLMNQDLREVSSKNYAGTLIDSIVTVFDTGKGVTIEKNIADFEIDARKAFTLGIILNELLTNVFKYAFGDREDGLVSVSIEKDENEVTLVIKDDGIGFSERALKNKSPGFGLTIVKMLAEQLGGTYTRSNDDGARSVVQFEL